MVNNVSPIRPQDDSKETESQRVKPNQPPRNDKFQKAYREGRPLRKEEEEFASIGDKEETPSLFDLPKKSRPKEKASSHKGSGSIARDRISSDTDKPRPTVSSKRSIDSGESEENEYASEFPPNLGEDLLTDGSQLREPMEELPDQIKTPGEQAQLTESLNQKGLLGQTKNIKKTADSPFETKKSESLTKKEKSEARSTSISGEEKIAQSGVQPPIQSINLQTETTQDQVEGSRSETIRDLAIQIIDRIQVLKKGDETSTIVTLRHPPILEGSTLTLTTTDQEKTTFNISFANLSPEAKAFLDRKLNEVSLSAELEKKGIVVNMITTTTQVENLLNVESSQSFGDKREEQERQRQRQQNRQSAEEEES